MKRINILLAILAIHNTHSKVIKTTLNESEQEIMKMSSTLNEVINLVQYRYYKALEPEVINQAMEDALQ